MDEDSASVEARRRVLKLGAIGASMVVTIRPALAQTAASVSHCEIPVPDASHAGQYIAADGSTVAPMTPGAFPAPGAPLKGQDVKMALRGSTLPGTTPQQSQAYTNYVRRLQAGRSGFTCYASLQMPGR